MLDFCMIDDSKEVKGTRIVNPKFILKIPPDDLMIRGGDIYAVWNEGTGMWVTGPGAMQFIIEDIDKALRSCAEVHKKAGEMVKVNWMWDADSKSMDRLLKYAQKQMPKNCYHELDEHVIFADEKTTKEDYASKKLPYAMKEGNIEAYEELLDTLYEKEQRDKLEWAIGAIISGDARHIQKFIVLYGEAGSGKSTVLNIIQKLFDGYYSVFDAKELASSNNAFALEAFKSNPLVSIQHDGDLSKIEDNTKLNSIVSHEEMEVNEKFKAKYMARFNTFLFMGTNKPVKITEAKSGLIRRLIDVRPTGQKVPYRRYMRLMKQIEFELGAIADHCLKVYKEMGESFYDGYVPLDMISATNDFYNFVDHNYDDFAAADAVTLVEAYKRYDEYCTFANSYKMQLKSFREELANYFEKFEARATLDGVRVRSLYSGFKRDKFLSKKPADENDEIPYWLRMESTVSTLDILFAYAKAQLEVDYGKGGQPGMAWAKCKTTLKDIDPHEVHYFKPPDDVPLIMIDFDMKGENGEKSYELNAKAASSFPPTCAELSKSGGGIHLYYLYDGDVNDLSRSVDKDIEIKVPIGGSAFRRRLTKCNNLPVTTLTGGLPLKKKKRMINKEIKMTQDSLREKIEKNLQKGYHADTSSSINFINKLLNEAYESGLQYDLTDMRKAVRDFAMSSTNQSDRCFKVYRQMKFKSASAEIEPELPPDDDTENNHRKIVLDTEIYKPGENNPGLFLICWKFLGAPKEQIVAMINPKPHEVEDLFKFDIIGYNCRDYDNHMLYAASQGKNNAQLYDLSNRIINLRDKDSKFGIAYNISWCDVYEYCKAAGDGKSLKKWEIELGISHKEMGIPWDEPAPLDRWDEIVEYCKNDVMATEAVFNATQGYLAARKFQVDLVKTLHGSGIKVCINDSANTLTKRIMFGEERNPQREFNYRNLALPVGPDQYSEYRLKFGDDYVFRVWNAEGLPEYRDYVPGEKLPEGWSILPFFPGYTFDPKAPKDEKSRFHDDFGGEGGRVFSAPGMYVNVWDGDIASQYPHSIIAEVLFGPKYTRIFAEIVKARIAVKHLDFEAAGKYLGGALKPYLKKESAKDLAQALKIIINAVYGLTTASFANEFRDQRNIDNLVAKRGNLFMLVLKEQIEKRGFKVCHIKTDSIKIVEATDEIKEFVNTFAKEYGYTFETEGEFAKFVLLNDAAYVAYERRDKTWVTKATQFQEPYVKKTLFTHEDITFSDICQTFNVMKGAIYLDMNEECEDPEPLEKRVNYLRSKVKSGKLPKGYSSYDEVEHEIETLLERIGDCHDLRFIGRVGSFCPVKSGCGGGVMYRVQDGKRYAIGGTSGYRWLESEVVKTYGKEKDVDMSYYTSLVDEAASAIAEYGDLEWFCSDALPAPIPSAKEFMNPPEGEEEEVPWET